MEKIWNIDGNEFFVRENAKEFLAMTWAKKPREVFVQRRHYVLFQ